MTKQEQFTYGTEMRNPRTMHLDDMTIHEIVRVMNEEDRKVAQVVQQALPRIEAAIEAVVQAVSKGGRLFYIGAGTSGRLGILDASECPPTFGVDPELVQGIIAGGEKAVTRSVENAEDDFDAGEREIMAKINEKDAVVGLAASGRTPYVIGAMSKAREIGAVTAGISCNVNTPLSEAVQYPIELDTGPEILTGSTRLKAGTAQKMVLNMISTTLMIRLGKAYENLMVDVQASNEKLRRRVERIIMEATGVSQAQAVKLAESSGGHAKLAIVMQLTGLNKSAADALLRKANGFVRKALEIHNREIDTQ